MSWRDKFGLSGAGTFAERPAASADIEEAMWYVIEGTTNLGKIYVVKSGAWVLIPLNEWLSAVAHTHPYAPTPHNNDHHSENYITSYADDDTDRASAVGATHSVKAKTAALADNSSLLEGLDSTTIMMLGGLIYGS